MTTRARVFSTSVGTKLLVGTTGLLLFLYLIIHIAGNVMVFAGRDTFNTYSHMLLSNPLVPAIEVGLVLVFLLHIYKTVTMYLANRSARPVQYERKVRAGGPSRKSAASGTMILSGLWLLAFVLIHVNQFKYGTEYAAPGTGIRDLYRLEMENFSSPLFVVIHVRTFKYGTEYETTSGIRDLYRLEMENFSSPLTVAFYVLSMLIVGSHLWHGVSSAFQSLGADHPTWTPRLLAAGKLFAVLVAGGFIFIALWAHVTGARS